MLYRQTIICKSNGWELLTLDGRQRKPYYPCDLVPQKSPVLNYIAVS